MNIHRATATLPPRILVHGKEGVGKTSLPARFPNSVFLQTEDGCPSGLEISTFGILTEFAGVTNAISALGGDHEFCTVVLDSIDVLEPLIWTAVCTARGWRSIESV